MINNPQLGYPDGPMPEDSHTQQLDSRIGQDHPLPPMQTYETLEMPIPANPLDLASVAQAVAQEMDWRDHASYSQAYVDRIVEATQAQFGNLIPENINQGPIPTVGELA